MIILELPASGITGIKLNPKYNNILMVLTIKTINFFEIPETFKNKGKIKIDKPRFIFNKKELVYNEAIFNPSKGHNIACSCFDSTIRIWSIRNPSIQKISCSEIPLEMKWDETGNLLGYFDESNFIKIYSILKKKEIFNLNLEEPIFDFEFFGKNIILIGNSNKDKIIQYEFDPRPKEDLKILEKNQYKYIYKEKFNFFSVCKDCLLIYSDNNMIKLFNDISIQSYNLIYQANFPMSQPKMVKSFKKNILFKILDIDQKNNAKLIILEGVHKTKEENELNKINFKNQKNIYEKNNTENSSFDNSDEDSNQDYFEDCLDIFIDIKECLNFSYNFFDDQYKKKKKYFKIDEVNDNLEKNKDKNLIYRREFVREEIKKIKTFNSIKEEYMFYLNLLIMDETNVDLLSKYLSFLQKNEKYFEKEKIPHEKFNDEIKYYSIFMDKNEIKKEFGNDFESEKTKLINLLENYSNSIKNKNIDEFRNKLKEENIGRQFNQPITCSSKEIIYYNCYKMIYYDISNEKNNSKKNFSNKLYALNKILENNIIENIESADILIPLMCFICNSEKEKNINFFINMINSKTITDEELKRKEQSLKGILVYGKNEKGLIMKEEYYKDPNEICFENINDNKYQECEKYNLNYLVKNPPLDIDIDKIKNLVAFVFKSNIFKEIFKLLTGKDNYENIFNNKMISEYIENIKFLPINFSNENSFLDCLSLVTYISTMKKRINPDVAKDNIKISSTLENGIIITIIYREFAHVIKAVLSYIEKNLKFKKVSKKKCQNFKNAGYSLELALFGRVIKYLSYGEVLYILNEDNYKKSLNNFQKGFMELQNHDLIIKGKFVDLNPENEKEINEYKRSVFIQSKKCDDIIDIYKDISISIPLRNDVFGREIKEEDLSSYF